MGEPMTSRRREREGIAGIAVGVLLAAVGYFADFSTLVIIGVIVAVFGVAAWGAGVARSGDRQER